MEAPHKIKYASIKDIQAIYGISRNTIYKNLEAGNIRAVKIGSRNVRIDVASVDAYFETLPQAEFKGKYL